MEKNIAEHQAEFGLNPGQVELTNEAVSELQQAQLAFVGGGIGDTVL